MYASIPAYALADQYLLDHDESICVAALVNNHFRKEFFKNGCGRDFFSAADVLETIDTEIARFRLSMKENPSHTVQWGFSLAKRLCEPSTTYVD